MTHLIDIRNARRGRRRNDRRRSRGNGFGRIMRRHTALIDAITEITDNQGRTNKNEQRPRRFELNMQKIEALPEHRQAEIRRALKGHLMILEQEELDEE
ncbi:hypothetical protein ACUHM3_006416 [Pseudomonas aeruginosa]